MQSSRAVASETRIKREMGRTAVAGFTLIELLLALAIVGILAALAYPSYRSAMLKGGRADAYAALAQTRSLLEQCYSRHADYTRCPLLATSPHGDYRVFASTLTSQGYALAVAPLAGKAQASDDQCRQLGLTHNGIKSAHDTAGNDTTPACWNR